MITSEEKKAIRRELGAQYSPAILAHLNSKKILNTKGQPLSPQVVQNIVNGRYENLIVEEEIVTLIEEKKALRENAQMKKSKVLK
ncbi:hypothetical protein [Flavobacterium sp. UBA4197]|uniref:hypothetical protein n=1 Tax=Flavobacterium sp. UBA4197 TaxID=1946546 RepID=UPI00257BBFC3|nr:hypothetical protein [Flavobacterium sp. UBA4197]